MAGTGVRVAALADLHCAKTSQGAFLEAGRPGEVRQMLTDAGLNVLDRDACELQGIGIAGVKGFGGGFGRHALGPWGETIVKQFVDEALELEAALALACAPQPHHPVRFR